MSLAISDLTEHILDPHIGTEVPLIDAFMGGHISGIYTDQSIPIEAYDRTNPSTVEFTFGVMTDAKVHGVCCCHRVKPTW